jgi:hypothetical protein
MKKHFIVFYSILLFFVNAIAQQQPSQPTSGPGGNDYTHAAVTMHSYDPTLATGVFIFEPASPVPDSANVIVFVHGLSFVNPYIYGAWIKHLVRHGNIVIYPKYQDVLGTTLTSSFNANAVLGIKRALDTLTHAGHVKPRLQNFAVAGHSYGGLMAPNMAILAASSGFPVPKAVFSCQGYTDLSGTTRLPDYSIMSSSTNLLIAVGDNDAVVGTTFGHFLMDSTINIPTSHKNLITHHSDTHGSPAIGSTHFEPGSIDTEFDSGETSFLLTSGAALTTTDAVDYFCYWKLLDALLDCSFYGTHCNYAFGDTPEQHGMGNWSDGQPVVILTVEPSATTEIKSIESKTNFNVYPNPSSGEAFVSFSVLKKEKVAFDIFNIYGQLVQTYSKECSSGEVNEKLDLRKFTLLE